MRLSKVCMRFQLTWLAAIAATAILLTACGEQVSQEEFEAVQRELETARSQLQSLETEKRELQTRNTLNKGSEGFSGGYWGSFAEILRPPGLFSQMCRPLIALRRGRCNL